MDEFNEKPSGSGIINHLIQVLLVIILFVLLGLMIYLLYYNLPVAPESINAITNKPLTATTPLSEVKQFYPNMKFNHNNISYKIDPLCTKEKVIRVKDALGTLENSVLYIHFYEVSNDADIDIICSNHDKQIKDSEYFVAGEGGAREIIQTGVYNVISSGVILLYENSNTAVKCDFGNVELHELMHVFGFNHSTSESSLMYPYLKSCDQRLDSSIINELRRLYSQENLPDLYFEDATVVRKGRYLDFNMTIKNSGTIEAKDVSYSLYDDNELVGDFKLDDIKYGAGIFVDIKNLKVIHRNPKVIKIVIDRNNTLKELDKNNNIVTVTFE